MKINKTNKEICKHKWSSMQQQEFRGGDYYWHKILVALCEKCAETKIVKDIKIKDFI